MTETIEVKNTPLTPEEIQRDFVDINGAAQILNDVSTKTAYSYMAKALKTHSVKVKAIDVVSNGAAKKLYRRSDVIEVAKILNKDKTVITYETVIIRPEVSPIESQHRLKELPKEAVLEANSKTFQDLPRLRPIKVMLGAQLIGLLIIALVFGYFLYVTKKEILLHMENLRYELQTDRVLRGVENEASDITRS